MKITPVNAVSVGLDFGDGAVPVGRLATRDRRIYFEYDAAFVSAGLEISPHRLPLRPGLVSGDPYLFEGLPGVFNDSLPDGWGRLLFDRALRANGTREAMHPADQFEAFRKLAEERGYGAEEIGARFGVSAQLVRQRLRLAAAAPELMTAYRDGALALDQLMAFCVSEDVERQRQVFAQMGQHMPVYAIRRAMTEAKVRADDRRAAFVGIEAYEAEGGSVLRDLFAPDDAGEVRASAQRFLRRPQPSGSSGGAV